MWTIPLAEYHKCKTEVLCLTEFHAVHSILTFRYILNFVHLPLFYSLLKPSTVMFLHNNIFLLHFMSKALYVTLQSWQCFPSYEKIFLFKILWFMSCVLCNIHVFWINNTCSSANNLVAWTSKVSFWLFVGINICFEKCHSKLLIPLSFHEHCGQYTM